MASRVTAAMASPPGDAGHVIRVESVEPYGWIVYLDGHSETHFFHSRPAALKYASGWAAAKRPSVVLLSNIAGHVERYAEYPEGDTPVTSG
jgi:hypothetical protein